MPLQMFLSLKVEITLIKGVQDQRSKAYNDSRADLLVFLKWKDKEKKRLRDNKPNVYKQFESIWNVRNNHMVNNLPAQYAFMWLVCWKKGCLHPLFKRGPPRQQELVWRWSSIVPLFHSNPWFKATMGRQLRGMRKCLYRSFSPSSEMYRSY